jgi:nitroreductase
MKAILERRSIRKYTDEPISDQDIKELLQAAMAAPSAGNQQSWEFIVVNDREILNKIPEVHPYSQMLKMAPLAIIVCGNMDKERHEGYWVQDCSAATENILIEAQYKGLGAVWLGVYPRKERIRGLKELFSLPENIIPLSIVSIGHPAESKEPSNRYDQSVIHINKW